MSAYSFQNQRFGLIHPACDAHTLGLSSAKGILEDCGYPVAMAGIDVCRSVEHTEEQSARNRIAAWIHQFQISSIGFSYRLDPRDGARFFSGFMKFLDQEKLHLKDGGPVRAVFFSGLPATCKLVMEQFPRLQGCFEGDETLAETLAILGIPGKNLPSEIHAGLIYDEARLRFGKELIQAGTYWDIKAVNRDYPGFGTSRDSLIDRVTHGAMYGLPPLMRAHVGPYSGDHEADLSLFLSWTKEMAAEGLLDVLSLGTSQLTQSHFFQDRQGLADGGGISINSVNEFIQIWKTARPMLVRTYAGSRDMLRLAWIYDEALNMAWHTFSFWWFSQIDGRGPNSVLANLREHFSVLKHIASVGKPFEPNVPHHFAFRGADDVTYIVSGYLAAKAAKMAGVRTLILQVMLNTPKSLWGIQDLARAQALVMLVRTLEDRGFKVLLQPRGGLDYFSPDLEKAKIQLAAVTAMMDDIEPERPDSPEIIHVVSYSEAAYLADPGVVHESIKITRKALDEYRRQKKNGTMADPSQDKDIIARRNALMFEAHQVISTIEALVPAPYSPEGFYRILEEGFLPVPYLWECREEFAKAVKWQTKLIKGTVQVVDDDGIPVSTAKRMEEIVSHWGRHP